MNQLNSDFKTGHDSRSSLEKIVSDWQSDFIEKLKEMHTLRYEYRKYRTDLDKELQSFLNALIDGLDAYDRMLVDLQNALTIEDKKAMRVVNNFASIRRKLASVTRQFGLKPMEIENDEFVAGLHKVIAVEYAPEYPEGCIIRVERQGYYWKTKILRPAEVVVASSREKETEN